MKTDVLLGVVGVLIGLCLARIISAWVAATGRYSILPAKPIGLDCTRCRTALMSGGWCTQCGRFNRGMPPGAPDTPVSIGRSRATRPLIPTWPASAPPPFMNPAWSDNRDTPSAGPPP
jgi:hypothetical protein